MKKAFTLVEMLIVIVIIGILAAALIPRLTGIQGRARDVARKGDLQQISTALATYNLDKGNYPITGGSSTTSLNTTAITSSTQLAGNTSNDASTLLGDLVFLGLMKSLPKESASGNPAYSYSVYNGGSVFSLMSLSEGGGVNANFLSGATIVAPITQSTNITTKLCTSVEQGAATTTPNGAACTADVNGKGARYVISN